MNAPRQRLTHRERAIRIELLRARAAIERQGLAHGVADVRESLTPRNLLESFLPRSRRRAASSGLLLQMLNLTRSYPMVLSLGSAVLSTVARRRMRLWKLAGGAALAWLLARNRRD